MEKAPAVEFERVESKPRADMSSRINVHAQEVEHKFVDRGVVLAITNNKWISQTEIAYIYGQIMGCVCAQLTEGPPSTATIFWSRRSGSWFSIMSMSR
jgi:hypothetical protein